MTGTYGEMWVTSALTNADVEHALVLCFSLRHVLTTRKIAVVASQRISLQLREALDRAFDFVSYIEEDRNYAGLPLEEFAKLYCLSALKMSNICIYLSPKILVVRNVDHVFGGKSEPVLLEDKKDTGTLSAFLFKPSVETFKAIMDLVKSNKNEDLKSETVEKVVESFKAAIKRILIPGLTQHFVGTDMSIIDLEKYPINPFLNDYQSNDRMEKLLVNYWLKIHRDQVLPLINGNANLPSPTPTLSDVSKEPIAIVGMSCRYPAANNLDEFWSLLLNGQDGTSLPPPFRWRADESSRCVAGSRNTNAGFLKDPVDEFDASFFGVSPGEALYMDPQHRLLHILVWEALEDACINTKDLRGSNGSVFTGSWINDYKDIINLFGPNFYRSYLGNSIGAGAAKISRLLGLTGASIATESGCSSSMVAVHLACRELRSGRTNLALACGVNLLLNPFENNDIASALSPDGHCKTFSEDADGFARSDGAGVLVLKRYSEAVRDGDRIWALIRGSAISQEGLSPSMGIPTVQSEAMAMQEALRDSGVSPEEISYVEAHGTGTVVGDPIEVSAITKAYKSHKRVGPLVIGSVKTNVGHTESCSGITGIIKVVLSLVNETIPAHVNFSNLNPSIYLGAIPAVIPLKAMEWRRANGKPRMAGVNSFGITGTEAHVVLEESQEIHSNPLVVEDMQRPLHLLKLSAKTEEALHIIIDRYRSVIELSRDSISDIAFRGNVGRADFPVRAVMLLKNTREICSVIRTSQCLKDRKRTRKEDKVCFLFPGQEKQYPGMANLLRKTSPTFQIEFTFCLNQFKRYGIDINDEIENIEIKRTIWSQPAIFCIEYALLKLWESWGVKPDYVLGHGVGEIVAAVSAGALSLNHAVKLVAIRSRIIDERPPRKLLTVQADEEVELAMREFAGGDMQKLKLLEIVELNSNKETVVAGDEDAGDGFSQFYILVLTIATLIYAVETALLTSTCHNFCHISTQQSSTKVGSYFMMGKVQFPISL